MSVICYICKQRNKCLATAFNHAKDVHGDVTFSVYQSRKDQTTMQAKHYSFKPNDCINQPIFDDETGSVTIKDSPFAKQMRGANSKRQLFQSTTESSKSQSFQTPEAQSSIGLSSSSSTSCQSPESIESANFIDLTLFNHEEQTIIQELVSHLHTYLDLTTNIEHAKNVFKLITLVSQGKFPINNISFRLFCDVVQFYSLGDSRNMRYSEDSKIFWAVGLKLFKGKFLRFMSGFKTTEKHNTDPQNSDINFVVPIERILREEVKSANINCDNVGLIESNIAIFAENKQNVSCKISIDGKKIASGLTNDYGDVDLYGHELGTTLQEKEEKLSQELNAVQVMVTAINQYKTLERHSAAKLQPMEKDFLITKSKELITITSKRIKELREIKVKKELALSRVKERARITEQQYRFAYAISAIQTSIFRAKENIRDLLTVNDNLGYLLSILQGVGHIYQFKGVRLDEQDNYVCLNGYTKEYINAQNIMLDECCQYVKQRSREWVQLRKEAKVTGSTIHRALGLNTLKSQVKYFDEKFENKEPEPFDSQSEIAIAHGVENEINATATTVGKILPIYYPTMKMFEAGCVAMQDNGKTFMIVSPDGVGSYDNTCSNADIALEFKCPLPGKKYITDVHYVLPKHYVFQVLSEMAGLGCETLLYVSYTPESTTLLNIQFDKLLWDLAVKCLVNLYGGDAVIKPKRLIPELKSLRDMMTTFVESRVQFIAELPSVTAIPCELHNEVNQPDPYGFHVARTSKSANLLLLDIEETLYKATVSLTETYNILRTPAKEVLVTVISDVDRIHNDEAPHSVPIAYSLAGYSLSTDSVRSMLIETVKKCKENGLSVPAMSFDGQFYKIAVRGEKNEPLTMLQLQKDTWEAAKKLTKAEQIKMIMDYRAPVLCPPNLTQLLQASQKQNDDSETLPTTNDAATDQIMSAIGESEEQEILIEITRRDDTREMPHTEVEDDEDIVTIRNSFDHWTLGHENMDITRLSENEDNTMDNTYLLMKNTLSDSCSKKTREHLSSLSLSDFKDSFKNPQSLYKTYTKDELLVFCKSSADCLKLRKIKINSSNRKIDIVNGLATMSGCTTLMSGYTTKSPPKLKNILKDLFSRKIPKHVLNVIVATNMFGEKLKSWRNNHPYGPSSIVHNREFVWFSKPDNITSINQYMFSFLDCHHIFVNARSKICSEGIPEMGLSRKAWVDVAKQSKQNGTGLSLAMVDDLIDKQSNAFAQTTFSESVEEEMVKLGYTKEARFCSDFRNWYRAEDERGLSQSERHSFRLNMRNCLLKNVNLGSFPPPGGHVKGMSVVMFEGILTNIDRRIQIYSVVKGNRYNVRSLSSLDSENFFGCFQDLDPSGSGVLRPADIPRAIQTASYIYRYKVDATRSFRIATSKTSVYPVNQLASGGDERKPEEEEEAHDDSSKSHIHIQEHIFDLPHTRKRKPKRKRGTVSTLNEAPRGVQAIRAHHKIDESKILPHIRYNINID